MTGYSYVDSVIHIYSNLVSALYSLMRRIFYIICTAPHCNITVTLLKHCVFIKGIYMESRICIQCDY